jgi:WD40 repeat protein
MMGKILVSFFGLIGIAGSGSGQPLLPAKPPPVSLIWSKKPQLALYSLAWSPNSALLAVAGRDTISLYGMPDFTEQGSLTGDQGEIWALAWSPSGEFLAAGGQDGTIHLWDGTRLAKKLAQGAWIFDLGWNPTGTLLVAVDDSGLAKHWDIPGGYVRAAIQLDGDGLGISWSPKGKAFAVSTGRDGSRVSLFDSASTILRWRRQDVPATYQAPFGYGRDEVNGVSFSPNMKWIASTQQDGRLVIWAAASGRRVLAVQVHEPGVGGARRVAWSPGSDWVATCGEDGRVNLIRFPGADSRIELMQSSKAVWSVAFSPNGKWIAATGDEGRVWVWNTPDQKAETKR